RLYGWTPAEACGRSIRELLYPDATVFEREKQILLERSSWSGELLQMTKGGRQALVSSRWTLVRDAQGAPKSVLDINTDITERRQLEDQLRQSQKMEA